MRTEKPWTNSDDVQWRGDPDLPVRSKLLNGTRGSEATTSLIESRPRPADSRRGQYHSADEEIFVLGGRFTFDGALWFEKRGYAFYPRGCVHGSNVYIREGYSLLLRYDGPASLEWVQDPMQNEAYFPADCGASGEIVEVHSVPNTGDGSMVEVHRLRQDRVSGGGTTLVDVRENKSIELALDSTGFLELLLVDGEGLESEHIQLQPGSYRYRKAGGCAVVINGSSPFSVLAVHGAELKVDRIGD
ncbi:hypothetical protein HFP57_15995 [Parasphingopyxis algicola]|uniref:hypothetical protein n=1 Tax=Parasphingopyxis algicola TaxID=2026624 RepID=UPI0015A49B12|nr:hypothetical protein [Parasphingopyxis algicola]QLC26382.1 hypothetical protein HFP57_15995 [Parasphingopyxis algicola]